MPTEKEKFLIERLQAIETIIGGTSIPSREELYCAAEELREVIKIVHRLKRAIENLNRVSRTSKDMKGCYETDGGK